MTKRFWLHVSVSSALAVAVAVFLWWGRAAGHHPTPESPALRAAVLALTLAFLFFFARLLLRSTGSDRTMGLMGLYGAALYLPFLSFLTGSVAHAASILLLTAALLEVLDTDLAPSGAVRSGLFASAACVIEPASLVLAAALVPVAAAVAWPRWKVPVVFALIASIPWLVMSRVRHVGQTAAGFPSVGDNVMTRSTVWWFATFEAFAREMRSSLQSDFLSPYVALALFGLVVATVRRMGPSRRGIAAAFWLLAVATLLPIFLDDRTASFLVGFRYLFLVLLASTGLAALAAMNPLHAGRRRMMPVVALFLLPPFIAWVRALV